MNRISLSDGEGKQKSLWKRRAYARSTQRFLNAKKEDSSLNFRDSTSQGNACTLDGLMVLKGLLAMFNTLINRRSPK